MLLNFSELTLIGYVGSSVNIIRLSCQNLSRAEIYTTIGPLVELQASLAHI